MTNYSIIYICIFQLIACTAHSQNDLLRQNITNLIKDKKARVGIGVYALETGDTLTVGGHYHYPTQSTYKFHLALTVLHKVDKGIFTLDQKIKIKKSDLKPETLSPLRDKYPNGNIAIALSEILNYTVSHSDNNGCDILFKLIGGPLVVERYMDSLGIKDISVKITEDEMHKNWGNQYKNWTTPYAAVQLLEKFYQGPILSAESYDFLWMAMVNANTAPDRIKGELPKGTIVAHKTGTSGRSKQGVRAAVNDIGIITLPNGKHIALAVFVSESMETDEANAKIIADIAKAVYDYYKGK